MESYAQKASLTALEKALTENPTLINARNQNAMEQRSNSLEPWVPVTFIASQDSQEDDFTEIRTQYVKATILQATLEEGVYRARIDDRKCDIKINRMDPSTKHLLQWSIRERKPIILQEKQHCITASPYRTHAELLDEYVHDDDLYEEAQDLEGEELFPSSSGKKPTVDELAATEQEPAEPETMEDPPQAARPLEAIRR